MKDIPKTFDRSEWNKKLAAIIEEHPELKRICGEFSVFSDKGIPQKIKIRDKVV